MQQTSISLLPEAEKLRYDNYVKWSACIQLRLIALDAWSIIQEEKTEPSEANAKKQGVALAMIGLNLSSETENLFDVNKTARENWNAIRETILKKPSMNEARIRLQLSSMKMEPKGALQFFSQLENLTKQLRERGSQITEEELKTYIVNGANPIYQASIMAIENNYGDNITYERAKQLILNEEERFHQNEKNNSNQALHLKHKTRTERKQKPTHPCELCKKMGHWTKDCFKNKNRAPDTRKNNHKQPNKCKY